MEIHESNISKIWKFWTKLGIYTLNTGFGKPHSRC
jgi:hypothetical protein